MWIAHPGANLLICGCWVDSLAQVVFATFYMKYRRLLHYIFRLWTFQGHKVEVQSKPNYKPAPTPMLSPILNKLVDERCVYLSILRELWAGHVISSQRWVQGKSGSRQMPYSKPIGDLATQALQPLSPISPLPWCQPLVRSHDQSGVPRK